jgi:hypothetical protein
MAPQGEPAGNQGVSANARSITIVVILAVTVLLLVWMSHPTPTTALAEIQCNDGPRRLIDATQFATQFWAYSIKLEGSLGAKGSAALALKPKQLQQLSEAMQQGNEFRKWLVNSYNACALPNAQYAAYGLSFEGMDNAARNIQEVLDKGVSTDVERASLAGLVKTYLQLAQGLQSSTPRSNP